MSDDRASHPTDAEIAAVIEAEKLATAGPWKGPTLAPPASFDDHGMREVIVARGRIVWVPSSRVKELKHKAEANLALTVLARNEIRGLCRLALAQAEALELAICGTCNGAGGIRQILCQQCGGSGKPRIEEAS